MEIAYVAGLFDGEGHIRIAKFRKPNSLHIRYQLFGGIGLVHAPTIFALQKQFGGSLSFTKRTKQNPNWRDHHTWTIASQTAASFLRLVRPFLVIKADEVDVALKLQARIDSADIRKFRGEGKQRDAEMAAREILYRKITELKHVSFPIRKQR